MKKPTILLLAILTSVSFLFTAAKNISVAKKVKETSASVNPANSGIKVTISALFSELHLKEAGMNQNAFTSALNGFQKLEAKGAIKKDNIITIIDFSQPSTKKRLYVLDLENKHVLFNTLVAHGKNSGALWTNSFSNQASSLKSSPGFYVTAETYMGDNGYSLRLDGQEKNINDNARNRDIVIHGAPYVNQSAINKRGFIGRSWGCPAVPESKRTAIINTIKDGTCLFIYNPNPSYLQNSPILNQS